MPPSEYFVRLQKGIVGGFAPPTPDAIYTVTKSSADPSILIQAAVRPDGQPELSTSAAPKAVSVDDKKDALVDELEGILKELPIENPPGSEDIYGLNTSIAWGSQNLEWVNGGPEGCGGGQSTVQATAAQKAKFRRAVEIVQELVGDA